jgi:hypothetical protein
LAKYFSLIPPSFFSFLSSHQIKSQNVLLVGYKSNELDKISTAKVADFGTVRADDRNTKGILQTTAKTHASTKMVVGTTPYMPQEVRSVHLYLQTAFGSHTVSSTLHTRLSPFSTSAEAT